MHGAPADVVPEPHSPGCIELHQVCPLLSLAREVRGRQLNYVRVPHVEAASLLAPAPSPHPCPSLLAPAPSTHVPHAKAATSERLAEDLTHIYVPAKITSCEQGKPTSRAGSGENSDNTRSGRSCCAAAKHWHRCCNANQA
eukprot:1161526-Pelagomonas_calceolata.AAC.3